VSAKALPARPGRQSRSAMAQRKGGKIFDEMDAGSDRRNVFVVHGRNTDALAEVKKFLYLPWIEAA
jgi:hypothetical protein